MPRCVAADIRRGVRGKPTVCDVAIIGGLPPPYGGVSVHIKRLLAHLDRAGIHYHLYNTGLDPTASERITPVGRRGLKWFLQYLVCGREPVVYVHTSQWGIWAATWWLSRVRGKAVVIALHTDSLRRLWPVRGRPAKRAILAAFRAAHTLVAVNSHIRDFLEQTGGLGHKTVVIPAFIEPPDDPSNQTEIAPAVRSFCESHRPIILANGAPILYDDGRDLYGIDMTIEMAARLREVWPHIGVIWYVLKFPGWNPSYLNRMTDHIRRRNLDAHWLFVEPTGEMYPLFRSVDLFVRPTCSDGDAVSVREALYFRVPTVASDASPRPNGTIVFHSRDLEDYVAKVRDALASNDRERAKPAEQPGSSAVGEAIALLDRIVKERKSGR